MKYKAKILQGPARHAVARILANDTNENLGLFCVGFLFQGEGDQEHHHSFRITEKSSTKDGGMAFRAEVLTDNGNHLCMASGTYFPTQEDMGEVVLELDLRADGELPCCGNPGTKPACLDCPYVKNS